MKKLLFIPVVLCSLLASAQSTFKIKEDGTTTNLAPNATIQVTTDPETNVKVTLDIKNISAQPQTYNAKRYDVVLNTVYGADTTAANAFFCFAGSCYDNSIRTSQTPIHLQPNKSASDTTNENPLATYYMLVADLDETTRIGYSVVKYSFINVNNAADSMQVTIRYNSLTTAIKKNNTDASSFEIYPNPANESAVLKINSLKAFDSQLTIINTLGAVVSERTAAITEGKNNIDLKIENLSTGIYFVNIKGSDTNITKKLIVK